MAIVIPKPVPKGSDAAPKQDKKAREGRSPAFPFIDLKASLERAEQFRVVEGKHLVPVSSAIKAWSLGEKTSAGRRTVAALSHFGFFAEEGTGDARKVRLSETALNILLDKRPESVDRDRLIQMAALSPPIHMELWEKWKGELPSDATVETYLVRDRGFSSQGALDFLAEYKATLAFANLAQSSIMSSSAAEEKPMQSATKQDFSGLSPKPSPGMRQPLDQPDGPPPDGTRREVFGLAEGDVVISFPENLSAESYEDLAAYFELFLRKAKRRAEVEVARRRLDRDDVPE
jgi:hypothetical protein